MNLYGIPPRFKNKTLGNFEMTDQRERVMEAVEAVRAGRSVFLTGTPGAGKTHLAVGLLYLRYSDDLKTLEKMNPDDYDGPFIESAQYGDYIFLPSVELFLELKASFGDKNSTEDSVLSQYTHAEILVIDDVGTEKVTDWSRQMFYTLIDRLYRNERQVVVTSNLTLSQISSQMDDRIASRMVEMGVVVEMNAVDYRLKLHKNFSQPGLK